MTRIATLAANDHLLNIIARTQNRVQDLEVAVTTGKRSQTYTGLADDVRPLLDAENRLTQLDQFQKNNDMMGIRLDATSSAIDGITSTVSSFRASLTSFAAHQPISPEQAKDLQDQAFQTLKSIEAYLNSDVDGRFLFGGSRVRTPPVDFGFDKLSDLQNVYNGDTVVYPFTADGHVGRSGSLTHSDTGDLTTTDADGDGTYDTITSATSGAFKDLYPGATITVSGGSGGTGLLDGTYTVVASDNDKNVKVRGTYTDASGHVTTVNKTVPSAATENGANLTVKLGSWYQGDTTAQTHRLDQDRSFSLAVNAIAPGFEKAIRAVCIIAQGQVGSAGELWKHNERLDQALSLTEITLDRSTAIPTDEKAGTLRDTSMDVGFQQETMRSVNDLHLTVKKMLTDRASSLEDADQTQVVTELMQGTNALEASYQVLARVQKLSLTNFL